MSGKGGKGGKGAKKVEAAAAPVDGRVELKSLQSVTDLLAKAKTLRNYFQLERDKIQKYWDISRKELENITFELRNSDQELESMEARHQVEMKVYKQKVRHLLYEHKLQMQQIREQSDSDLKESTSRHQEIVSALKTNKSTLHSEIDTQLTQHEEKVLDQREMHTINMKQKKQDYDKNMKETQRRYEQKLSVLRDELELRRRAEIHDIEERKNEHINELTRKHEEAFSEMKKYYNDITTNNLELIKSLKDEIANMKKNTEHNENLMFEISRENKNLKEPLDMAKVEVAELQQKLHDYEKNKLSLRNTRSRLKALDLEFAQLQDDHKALQQRYYDVSRDKDALVQKFEAALHDASDVTREKNMSLQERLLDATAKVEARDAQLANVLSAVNLEPGTLEAVTRKLEDILETKNRAIKDLHFELRKVESQHTDVIKEYERRCHAAGIPTLDVTQIV